MFFSIFAYLWLMVILVLNTENKVEVWEAAITLCFVPVVVLLSWMAEKGWMDTLLCQTRSDKVKIKHMNNLLFLKLTFVDTRSFSVGIWK